MSIELPEAHILAEQMNKKLVGKEIVSFHLQNHEKMQRLGFITKEPSAFEALIGGRIETVVTRGNVIRVGLSNGWNLVLAPEYGGTILYHTRDCENSGKFHLELKFTDNSRLTVTLTGMGVIQALKDEDLGKSYVYRRDFSSTASPMDAKEFTFERFSKQLSKQNVNVKNVLVGKDAIIVGLSNSAFQDMLFRAGIHPKRKAASLTEKERHRLYNAIETVIQARIQAGGKTQFQDLHGKQGAYTPAMGPNMKAKPCQTCGTKVEKLTLGGGQTYYCPTCQK